MKTIQKKGALRAAEPVVVGLHQETDIKADSVTIFSAHPLFQVVLKMHSLEAGVVQWRARAQELDVALDQTIAQLVRAKKTIKKLRRK